MNNLGKLDDFIRAVDTAQTIEEVAVAVRQHINLLGFECFTYQLLRSPEGPRPQFYITGYPHEWDQRYSEQKYVSHDMVSRHAARVVRPFAWLEIGRYQDFTPEQKLVFDEAAEFGIRQGGAVPIHGPGLAKALFTVVANLPDGEFMKLFNARRHEVHIIATYVHERLLALGLVNPPTVDMHLTPRELEIMTWTARGKTKWEISEILTIGETTVKSHLDNACRKLHATNKTHATAVALIHGLIVP